MRYGFAIIGSLFGPLFVSGIAAAEDGSPPPPPTPENSPQPTAPPAGYPPPGYYPAQGYYPPPAYYPPPGNYPPPAGYPPPGNYPPPGYYPAYPPTAVQPATPPSARLEGFMLSVALGYASAWGDADKDSNGSGEAMTDVVTSHVPFILGVGFRPAPMFSFGGVFQYGVAQLKNDCSAGVSCSAADIRVGVEGRLHLIPDQLFSPWISLGVGYEWFTLDSSSGSRSTSATFSGWEFMNLEAGGDFRVATVFTVGPFLGVRVQQFDHMKTSGLGSSATDQDIPSSYTAVHGWVAFGVRGAFTL